ncbi:MAG: VaFE repeat-containing surface-anchored protein [Lachnospiraceae bacterium]
MDRLRGPPVLKAGNKQQTDPVRFSDGISHKKGMTMNLKNKKGKRLTSTLMAVLMSVSTTLTPVNTMASELETSSAAVESTLEETTAETQVQTVSETAVSKTQEQTASETTASEAQTSASEMQPVPETTEEVCTEEVQTSGEGAEETSANETRGPDDEETAETAQIETEVETMAESTSEIETEGSTEVEKADPFAALDPSAGFTEEALAAIDFSSKRLLIAADPAVIIDPEHVLSSYAGVYLMQYETESQAKYAYAYYYGKSEFVDVDTVISVADGDNSANAAAPMAVNENPIAELHEAVAGNPVKAAGAVAVIDTGVNGVANVTESVSMIGDNTADENGHGTKMAQLIAEQNPDVSILSIKALGADGTGDVSAVYAAIQYAIDKKVSVINLSMSAVGTAENAALTSIIDAAVEAGIAVVGAAGNKGMDVRFFVPGNIESAYIIGAADENGARITSSNYGSTIDFNVVADSTSEAAAKFSGYYTLNGAVADEKLVFPTDYVKEEKIDYNGPIIKHQISFYNYQGSRDDLVWISEKLMKTEIDDEYITARIGFAEDAQAVSGLDIYVDFMSIDSEHAITDECTVDLTNMIVKIPASYKDFNITIRWYMPNASYQYCYDTDEKYMISNTPEKFKVAYNAVGGLTLKTAQDYVNGTYKQGRTFTHTADSMNHCYVNYSTDGIKVGDYYTITSGYIASVEEKPGIYTTRGEIASMFGPNALNNITEAGYASTQAFLVHFNSVTRDYDSADVSGWFNTVGGKSEIAPGIIRSDIDNIQYTRTDGTTYYTTEEVSASLGWVFGTCANNEVGGQCPTFEPGGKIICTSKDADGTAYFFYYCRSLRAQWAGGSFSITPVFPKTGYLRIHKTSSDPALTDGNSCYNFTNITYKIYSDSSCTTEVQTLYLDQDGYSQSVELTEGTYYIKETDAVNSGYALDTNVYTVTVTAGTTFDAPQTWSTKDAPLNDPLGIVINKINSDGTTAADLSGAEYTITYYPKQYTSVAEIAADTDPEVKPTVWVIQTKKHSDGSYYASLRDECIVPNSNSAGAVFGKNHTGTYVIPLGTITVEETKAPEGFTKDGAIVSSAKTGATISGTNNVYLFQFVDENSAVYLKSGNALSTSLDDETAVTLTYAELQINGSPKMEKHDFELSKKATMGGTSFEGISFEIYCLDDSVAIGNDTYTKGQTITTVTSDEEGNIDVGMQFPVGHYAVREKAANNYYTMTTDQIHYFDVVEYQGEAFIQYESDTNAVTFMDRVVRGDLSFVKKNSDTDEALAYIPFRITNNTTGETHYILTDANGNFTSATGKTTNTNANDVVLSQYGDKDVIPQSVVDSLAKDAGLWFGMGSEGTMTAANDSYSSFVYGTYTITELKTEATRSMKMYTNTFTIDTDGKVLDLGTVNNVPMRIKTTLVDVNGEHFTEATSTVTLTDHVAYKNLDTDKTYTLTGTLYVKDGDALTEMMTETVDFQPTETSGTQDVTFTFDASELVGKSVVAFEELSVNGEFCAEHKDKDDENQTVTFPGIQTTARDNVTEDHVSNATDSITIVDTVAYTGLKKGDTYTVTGTLMDAKTGEAALDDDGNAITASKEFTAPTADGNIDITFTFAGVSLAGKTLVAFEDIYYEGRRYAVHADINDKNQTVYIPKIRTKALDANTGLNQVLADSNATVVDTVTYTHLLPGKTYVMKGVLMTSAGNALMVNGKTITASTEFVPTTPGGTVDVTFNFDASEIGGRKLVVYEYLELDGSTVASHTDISDTDQTIYVPKIRTTIFDSENGSHNSAADEDITLIDTVRYNGVEIGRRYTVVGTLVDKETGNALLDDAGNKITASNEFVAEKINGTIDVIFKFSGVCLAGKTTVAFEDMYSEGKKVAVHADLRDEGQTEYFPSVHTTATSNDTEDHVVGANEKVTITDQVALKALKLGTEYTLSGTFMNAKTKKPIMVNGNTITARRTFTADAHEMTIPLTYTLNASELAGTTTVVFENLYSDGALLAAHADLEDAEQTVYIPEIHTTAKDQTTKINHTEANKTANIVDTVSYTNLLPGREYTVSGTLMDKETGKAVLADGKEITASTTFTPEKSEGSVDVIFTFDASVVAPKTVVAFETLTYKKIQIAVHAEIEDKDQTVYIPKVRTTAIADDTKDHVTEAKKEVTIVDTVSYEGLEVDREYTVKGVLMNKATGKVITVNGKEVTAESTFTTKAQKGTVDVTFTFDGSALEDTLIVVLETLYTEGKKVGVHADIEDDAQTVYLPKIRTNAKDSVTEIDHTEALPKAKIIDTVSYSSLLPGKEYTVTGTLMNKKTGEPVLIDGKKVTAGTTFVAEKAEGSVEVVFEFDASAIAGTTVVAFESMEYKGIEVAVHADIEDENQTVYIPDVHTTATATDTEDHVTGANKEVTITDEVALTGLKVGNEYTVKGVLMDKTTGKELLVDEEQIVSEETFVADKADMTITLTYTLDAYKLAGKTTVVFETLYTAVTEEMGVEVGRHHEIDDEGQTVYIPEIHTTAADQKTGINHIKSEEQATIVDTVLYSHLLPGKEYTVKGTLMNKKTGEAILINGEEVTVETTFTAEKSEGSVDVIFTFDASAIAPTTVVAFEHLEYKGIEIAVHEDIEDEDQTVYIPEIGTTALGQDTEDHIEKAKEDAVIVDTVEYKGLEVGREYTMTGTLVDKETGEAITDAEGNEITTSEIFVAEEKDGSIDITFKFDASALAGKSLVAFETLYTEGKEVAIHADLEDEGQTIRIPEIHTTATDKVTGDHDGVVAKETTVLDEVFYTNLIPGKEYTVSGKLMVKETGEPLTVDGKEVTAEKTFVAEEADGSIILEFTFDSSALVGKKIVAFEDITYEGISIGSHEDLTDEDQTISYPEIHTTAVNGTDGSKTMVLGTNVTLVDTVTYKGLTEGKTYVLKGTIMDKASGQPIGVTAETTFTAEASDGSAEVTFTFDTTKLQGKTLVVFETMYDTQGNPIVDHSDLNDEDQTVSVPVQPVIPPVVTGDDSSPMPYVLSLLAALAAAVAVVAVLVRRKRKQA